ncbi:hypothetical protein NC651_001316 [Populus alba x Populus x berolinensis]|nr:hypothetical protein NC651_001316 [Populus alba x Populus x berolinensis]
MVRPPPPNPVKLAAIAVNLNIRLRSADMPGAMQERAFRCTRTLLDATSLESKKPNPTHICHVSEEETFANYDSSSSSNSSSVAVYWESCKTSFQCVDLGSETVVDKKVMEWETKINKGDVVSSKE